MVTISKMSIGMENMKENHTIVEFDIILIEVFGSIEKCDSNYVTSIESYKIYYYNIFIYYIIHYLCELVMIVFIN